MKVLRVYTDTSVFGGVFDDEFSEASKAFFHLVRLGRFTLLVSDVSSQEIEQAPAQVRKHFGDLYTYMQLIAVNEEIFTLRNAYIAEGVVTEKSVGDATHVAAATVAGADLIVSWNFKHIVHFEKIRFYNAVNAMLGYHSVDIRSPLEVIDYEEKEV